MRQEALLLLYESSYYYADRIRVPGLPVKFMLKPWVPKDNAQPTHGNVSLLNNHR